MFRFARFYRINDQRILFNIFAATLTLRGKLLCFHFSDNWEADYITELNIVKHVSLHAMISANLVPIWLQSYMAEVWNCS